MYGLGRMRDDGRWEFVQGLAPGGAVATTTAAQKAMMFASAEAADKLARELGNEWYPIKWRDADGTEHTDS